MIIDKEFWYLLDLLPSAYKSHDFIYQNEVYAPNNLRTNDGANGEWDNKVNNGPDGRPNNEVQVKRCDVQMEKLHDIRNFMTVIKMEVLTTKQI
jgi:hypothetical protein